MSENYIFDDLFDALSEDNAEELWLDILGKYLEHGGDVNVRHEKTGWTLLHHAADNLFSSVIEELINSGADVNSEDEEQVTPYLLALNAAIDYAVQYEHPDIDFSVVKQFIDNGANDTASSTDGLSRDSILQAYGEKITDSYHKYVKSRQVT